MFESASTIQGGFFTKALALSDPLQEVGENFLGRNQEYGGMFSCFLESARLFSFPRQRLVYLGSGWPWTGSVASVSQVLGIYEYITSPAYVWYWG